MFKKFIFYLFIFFTSFLQSQLISEEKSIIKDYQLSSKKYITIDNGSVFMKVHVWGAIGQSGTFQVDEGIDFASLISNVGGPIRFANLKKIRLYREEPDENGQLVYFIDLHPFLITGDRSNFPKIKPNDTIVIRKTWTGVFIDEISTVQTIFTALTFFIQFYTLLN